MYVNKMKRCLGLKQADCDEGYVNLFPFLSFLLFAFDTITWMNFSFFIGKEIAFFLFPIKLATEHSKKH